MSVYIKGLKMPKEGFVEVLIRDDGTVQQTGQSYRIDGTDYYTPYVGEMPTMFEAVEVPPHGRLIDADELKNDIHYTDDFYETPFVWWDDILESPTVIPSDKDGET